MHNPVLRKRLIPVVSLAAAAVLAGSAQMALADSGTSAAPQAPKASKAAKASKALKAPTSDGAKGLCKRQPKIETRIDRALKRLDGGANVRGSVARMDKRVTQAKTAGHTEIETYLHHKLATRTSMVKTLRQRQQDLNDVKTWCQKNDNGKKTDQSATS